MTAAAVHPTSATPADASSAVPGGEMSSGLAALPGVLALAHAEIQAALANLREGQNAIESAAIQQLQLTNAKLLEVTSTTEVAASGLLDALDRAGGLVDALETADQAGDRTTAATTRDALRDEIFGMMGALQFQDITAQQLAHSRSVLSDVESRMLHLAALFDPARMLGTPQAAAPAAAAPGNTDASVFDPRATMHDAPRRQDLADTVMLERRPAA